MVHLLAARLMLGLFLAQEPTVAEVLAKMEEAAREARGVSLSYSYPPSPQYRPAVTIADDGAVRVPGFVAAKEGLYRWSGGANLGPYRTLERTPIQPAEGPPVYPGGFEWAMLSALAPDRFLPVCTGLQTAETDTIDGEACLVLLGRIPHKETPRWENMVWGCGTGMHYNREYRLRYFVSTKTWRLVRMICRIVKDPPGADSFYSHQFLEWASGVPGRVAIDSQEERHDRTYTHEYALATREAKSIPPDSIRPRKDEIVATHLRDPEFERALENDPDNPNFLYSSVLRWTCSERKNWKDPIDVRPAVAKLEKALDQRWGEFAAEMLLACYLRLKDEAPIQRLLDRASRRPDLTPEFRRSVGEILSRAQKTNLALRLLAKPDEPGCRWGQFRVRALVDAGRLGEALEELATSDSRTIYSLFDLFHTPFYSQPEEFARALGPVLERHPASPLIQQVAFSIYGRQSPEDFLKVARTATRDPAEWIVPHRVLEMIGLWFHHANSKPSYRLETDRIKELKGGILEVLGRFDSSAKSPPLQAELHRICGDLAEARAALEKSIERSKTWEGYNDFQNAANELLRELKEFGDDALWRRGFAACQDAARRLKVWGIFPTSGIADYMRHLVDLNAPQRLYHELKGGEFPTRQYAVLGAKRSRDGDRIPEAVAQAIVEEARRQSRDASGLLWLARAIERDRAEGDTRVWPADPLEFYEAALAAGCDELTCLDGVARGRLEKGDVEGASTALEVMLRLMKAGRAAPERLSPDRLVVRAAAIHLKADRRTRAETLLRQADLKSRKVRSSDLWTAADLWRRLDRSEEAVESLRVLERRGYRPHLVVAEIREGQRNYVEQMRALNRAISEGYDPLPTSDPRDAHRLPADAGAMKAQLLIDLGKDYFIRRLLDAKVPPLSAEDAQRARALSTRLVKGDLRERIEAIESLRKLGPGAAAILADHLGSDDSDMRDRVRRVLTEWAEPR